MLKSLIVLLKYTTLLYNNNGEWSMHMHINVFTLPIMVAVMVLLTQHQPVTTYIIYSKINHL